MHRRRWRLRLGLRVVTRRPGRLLLGNSRGNRQREQHEENSDAVHSCYLDHTTAAAFALRRV